MAGPISRVLMRALLASAIALPCTLHPAAAQLRRVYTAADSAALPPVEGDTAVLLRIVETIASGDSTRITALRGRTNRNGDWWLTVQPRLVHDCWTDRRNTVVCSYQTDSLAQAQARMDAMHRLIILVLGPRGWRLTEEYPARGALHTRRYTAPDGARAAVRMTPPLADRGPRLMFFLYPPPAPISAPPRP